MLHAAAWRIVLLPAAILALATGCSAPAAAPNTTEPDSVVEPIDAVLEIEASPCRGQHRLRGTAVAIGPELAATVAHTFGATDSFELTGNDGKARAASVVWLDTARDLALLRLDDPPTAWLPLGDEADGADLQIITAADPDGFASKPASILRHVTATLDGEGGRAALELEANIKPGDSGAPLVSRHGDVVGIVFAASQGNERGWAIAASEIADALDYREDLDVPLTC